MKTTPNTTLEELAIAAFCRDRTKEFPEEALDHWDRWHGQSKSTKKKYRDIAAKSQEYVFFREGTFYPITLLDDVDAVTNAEWNPGTIRVEDLTGRVVWTDAKKIVHPMTNPITEPTQSIRERLARLMAAQFHRAAYQGREGEKEYCDETWEAFLGDLDAILAELQEPSEGMLLEGRVELPDEDPGPNLVDAWQAMVQHIRDGGS